LDEKRFLIMTTWILLSSLVLSVLTLVPLSMKWQLESKLTIPATVCIGVVSGGIVCGIFTFWSFGLYQAMLMETLLIGAIASSLLLWRFYRDPERVPPEDENAILSPADGEVIYVKKIEKGEIPFSDKRGRKFSLNDFIQAGVLPQGGYLIGIAMNFLDVHINRAPISGRISLLKYIKGTFLSLKKKEAVVQNERNLIIIDNEYFKLGIVQIASRLVRKIVPYVQEGQEIQKGTRIGAIRFGSQVDLILSDLPSIHLNVDPGDKLKAGLSIIATIEELNKKK
jgi:phosphatidylserine decarboxylase